MAVETKAPVITSLDQLDLKRFYTYAEYLTWQFKERVELWKGKVMRMSPAPNRRHQEISMELTILLGVFLKSKMCGLYSAPFDVRLPGIKGKGDTVVQPDLIVVCDPEKLDEQGCNGAPDLIVEILSPGNSKREMKHKFDLYETAGVREYWIVDPLREHILVFVQKEGRFIGKQPYLAGDQLVSDAVEGFVLDTSEILNEMEER